MGDALALAAAVAFAVGTVLQQRGTLSTKAGEQDPRFLVEILREPVWLLGLVGQVLGWVLQAMALDRASLVVVQSLTATSLVVALPLGAWLTNQHIGRREVTGALLTLVGLVTFLWAGQPQGGTSHPSGSAWWVACGATLVLVVALGALGRRLNGAEKAVALGVAAGVCFGLQAAVTKTFVTEIRSGLLALLTDWTVYVLIASALIGFVLQQSALKTAVLAPAMASSNAMTLFSSVVLGVAVYGEQLSKSGGAHVGAAFAALAVALVGIVLLAGAQPPEPARERLPEPAQEITVDEPHP
jgi:drug/metabolite transporter (DMT)-like permease